MLFLIGAKAPSVAGLRDWYCPANSEGVALITVVLAVARAISFYGIGRIEDASTRFTLQRVERLAVALAVAVIVVSIIFVELVRGGRLRSASVRSLSGWLCKLR